VRTACLALLVAVTASCGGGGDGSAVIDCPADDRPAGGSVYTVVLYDKTTSVAFGEIRERYLKDLDVVLCHFEKGGGGTLASDAIGARAHVTSAPTFVQFPKKSANTNPLVFKKEFEEKVEEARARAEEVLNKPEETLGTEIINTIEIAADHFARADGDERRLVIMSDMIEESDDLRFTAEVLTPGGTQAFIDGQKASGDLPDLANVDVYVTGAGVSGSGESTSQRVEEIKRFWQSYFEAAGADLASPRYRGTLPSFP
jgi:hypothetical protein